MPTSVEQTLMMAGDIDRLLAVAPPRVIAVADDGIRVIGLGLTFRHDEARRKLLEMRQASRIPLFQSWIEKQSRALTDDQWSAAAEQPASRLTRQLQAMLTRSTHVALAPDSDGGVRSRRGCYPAVTPALELVDFEFHNSANNGRSSAALASCKPRQDREIGL